MSGALRSLPTKNSAQLAFLARGGRFSWLPAPCCTTLAAPPEEPLRSLRGGSTPAAAAAAAVSPTDGGGSRREGSRRGRRTRAWQLADGMAQPLSADIVQVGTNVVLRQPAEAVPESMLGSPELLELVDTMVHTMRAAPGVGLAAPQIGVPLQVIVLEDRPEYIAMLPAGLAEQQQRRPFEPLAVCNPRLTPLTDAGARFFEGCLSVPGYQALVERFTSVELAGVTPGGAPLRLTAHGWQARILQHECDHLAGVLYVDRMVPRSFAARGGARLPPDVPRPGPCSCCHPIDGV